MLKYLINTILICLLFSVSTFGGEYVVDRGAENLVKFISKTPWEDFEGVTKYIDGYVYWEGEELTYKSELYFEVELNTVETGNGKRDRDMRNDYLHTNRFPYTHYTGKIIDARDSTDTIKKITSTGFMYIHGVEKQIEINALMIEKDDGYLIESSFDVKLPDYDIKIPELMIIKIDEVMQLKLTFFVRGI
jgi:polyisoprenoid-binding protein YceI